MFENTRVFAEMRDFRRFVDLTAVDYREDGERYAASSAFEKIGDGVIVKPTLRISPDAAQALMDSLWQCGLRPTEGSGSAGSLAATERHLADMRAIAVAALKSKGVDTQLLCKG